MFDTLLNALGSPVDAASFIVHVIKPTASAC